MITAVLCSRNFSKFRLSETRNFTLLLRNFVSKRNSVSSKLKFLSFRHQISFRRIYHLPCQISTSLKQYFAAFPSETKVRNLLISLSLLLHSTVDSFQVDKQSDVNCSLKKPFIFEKSKNISFRGLSSLKIALFSSPKLSSLSQTKPQGEIWTISINRTTLLFSLDLYFQSNIDTR